MPSNIVKLVTALLGPVQDVENALNQLLTERSLDNATGVQLDVIGDIVGQPRNGLSDDDYRRYCRARIRAERSNGTTENLVSIGVLIIDDTNATVRVTYGGTATALVQIQGIAVTAAVATALDTLLEVAKSAGVRLALDYSLHPPIDTFTFDTGPGFDAGHLAWEIG